MTEENILAIGSIAQDLKRVASFIGRGSTTGAHRFLQEAKNRLDTVDTTQLPVYVITYIEAVKDLNETESPSELAEKSLTIGCILQNAAVAARH